MLPSRPLDHRGAALACKVIAAATALALAACLSLGTARAQAALPTQGMLDIGDELGRISTEEVVISDGPYARQVVFFRSNEPPGTLVIHTAERFVYLIQGNNRALRYGIGVGREGFQWSGLVQVTRKTEWPDWRPPLEGGFGRMLGLDDAWALHAVRAAGNYSEIYERNLGVESRLGIPRGLNQFWNIGGVLYVPPIW